MLTSFFFLPTFNAFVTYWIYILLLLLFQEACPTPSVSAEAFFVYVWKVYLFISTLSRADTIVITQPLLLYLLCIWLWQGRVFKKEKFIVSGNHKKEPFLCVCILIEIRFFSSICYHNMWAHFTLWRLSKTHTFSCSFEQPFIHLLCNHPSTLLSTHQFVYTPSINPLIHLSTS